MDDWGYLEAIITIVALVEFGVIFFYWKDMLKRFKKTAIYQTILNKGFDMDNNNNGNTFSFDDSENFVKVEREGEKKAGSITYNSDILNYDTFELTSLIIRLECIDHILPEIGIGKNDSYETIQLKLEILRIKARVKKLLEQLPVAGMIV